MPDSSPIGAWRRLAGRALLLAALALIPASPARADLAATRARIRAAEKDVTTIQAAFVQEKKVALFAKPLVSRGTLLVAKPDRFFWAVDSPDVSGFALEGTRARTLLPGGKGEAIDLSRFRQVSDVMKEVSNLFLGRIAEGDAMFQVEDRTPARGPIALALTPLDERVKRYFTRIDVTFASDARSVETIRFQEPLGDETILRFSHVVLNEAVDFAARVREWGSHAR